MGAPGGGTRSPFRLFQYVVISCWRISLLQFTPFDRRSWLLIPVNTALYTYRYTHALLPMFTAQKGLLLFFLQNLSHPFLLRELDTIFRQGVGRSHTWSTKWRSTNPNAA
jgi:hypothetical protein